MPCRGGPAASLGLGIARANGITAEQRAAQVGRRRQWPARTPGPVETMMNHRIRAMRRPRRAWPSAARTVAAVIAAVGLALLAAACSGSPSSTGSGGTSDAERSTNSHLIAYAQCVRSHGVPNFPYPNSSGEFPKGSAQELGVSSSQFQAAQAACRHLYPDDGGSRGVLTKDSL